VDLYPVGVRDRAAVDEFLDRWALSFRPAFFRYESPALGFVLGKGMLGRPPRPEELADVAAKIEPTLELLDSLIDPAGYALGRFTIADVAAAPILFRTTKTGLDLDRFDNLARWRDALVDRPTFVEADPVT
jgi:glutathione S-transferase